MNYKIKIADFPICPYFTVVRHIVSANILLEPISKSAWKEPRVIVNSLGFVSKKEIECYIECLELTLEVCNRVQAAIADKEFTWPLDKRWPREYTSISEFVDAIRNRSKPAPKPKAKR